VRSATSFVPFGIRRPRPACAIAKLAGPVRPGGSVGAVQPFERLRYLARWGSDEDGALVAESADCLAGFDDDPAGLVVACRRLLHHHPDVGALWWLCSRVLCAPEPAEAAIAAWELLHADNAAARLAAALPFPHDPPVAVLGWPDTTAEALTTRRDLDVIAIRRRGAAERLLAARLRRTEATVRVVSDVEAAALEPTHLLVEVAAISPAGGALVPAGASAVIDGVGSQAELWFVAPVGRLLPDRLFTAMQRATVGTQANNARRTTGELDDPPDQPHDVLEAIGLGRVARVAGPSGLVTIDALARRLDCPTAPELLHTAG
jgi:hypothetical protein